MFKQEQRDEFLKDFFSKFLLSRGFELVDLEIKPAKERNKLVRFLVDKNPAITLDECAELNRQISDIIDEKDLIEGSYLLEVASPGLDRPLRTRRDFERVKGKKLRVIINKGGKTPEQATGKMAELKKDKLILDINGQLREIPINEIIKARLTIDLKGIK